MTQADGSTLAALLHRAKTDGQFAEEFAGITKLGRLGIQGLKRTGIAQINTGVPATR